MEERKIYFGLRSREWIGLAIIIPILVVLIFAAKPFVSVVLDKILHLNPTMVYVVVFLLVFAEAAIFFGFIFPGETAVILGGVVASGGSVNVVVLCALVVVGAIAGDSVGYLIGERHGDRVLNLKILQHHRGGLDSGLELLRRRGALAVFIGRFTAFLRAVMPGLAGLSRMHYRTFLKANAAGALVWGIGFTLLGYVLGGAYKKAEKYAGWASTALLLTVLVIAVGLFIRGRIKERRLEQGPLGNAASGSIEDELEKTRKSFEEKPGQD